jgi:alkylmercury lyase
MNTTQITELAQTMQERLLALGPDHTRLLIQIMRQLAHGHPLTTDQVDHLIAEGGIAPDAAHQFLEQNTERDADERIIGIMGLSLGDHPHRLEIAGVSLAAWCALDTLFLPVVLDDTATITSPSPVTHQPIQVRVSPQRVEEVHPAGAVVSYVLPDSHQAQKATVVDIWNAFCNHVHFFTDRREAEQWANGRKDIAILTVEEGFAWGRQVWSKVLHDAT